MAELRWFRVCAESELKPGHARSIRLLARLYAVFNLNGTLHGLDGACRHMKANLALGRVDDETVECFMHGWRYNIRSGKCLTEDYGDVRTYPVKLEAGQVMIGLEWPPLDQEV